MHYFSYVSTKQYAHHSSRHDSTDEICLTGTEVALHPDLAVSYYTPACTRRHPSGFLVKAGAPVNYDPDGNLLGCTIAEKWTDSSGAVFLPDSRIEFDGEGNLLSGILAGPYKTADKTIPAKSSVCIWLQDGHHDVLSPEQYNERIKKGFHFVCCNDEQLVKDLHTRKELWKLRGRTMYHHYNEIRKMSNDLKKRAMFMYDGNFALLQAEL